MINLNLKSMTSVVVVASLLYSNTAWAAVQLDPNDAAQRTSIRQITGVDHALPDDIKFNEVIKAIRRIADPDIQAAGRAIDQNDPVALAQALIAARISLDAPNVVNEPLAPEIAQFHALQDAQLYVALGIKPVRNFVAVKNALPAGSPLALLPEEAELNGRLIAARVAFGAHVQANGAVADAGAARAIPALAGSPSFMVLTDDALAATLQEGLAVGAPLVGHLPLPEFKAVRRAVATNAALKVLADAALETRIIAARAAAAGAADVADARVLPGLAADADVFALGDDQFADFLNLPRPPAHVHNFAALKAALPAANPLAALPEATLNKRIMTARTAAAGAADVADARIVAALAADADLMALGDDQFADFLNLPHPPAHVPNFAALKAALPAANPLAALPEATLNKRIMTARTAAAGAADVADARIVAALAADADLMALGDDQFADFLNLPHPPAHVPNFAALKAALPAANPLAALPEATLNKRIMTARTAAAGAADVADARIVAALAADADLMALGDDQFADFLNLPHPPAHVPNFAALKAALPAANPLAALPEATLNKRIMTARTAAAGAADVADARIVAALAADADLMALGDDQFADFLNLPHPPAHVPNFAALKAALPAANPLAALPEATLNKRIMTARTAAAGAADVADARIVAALAADADLMALGDDQFADFLNLPHPPAHVPNFAALKAALPAANPLAALPEATLNKRIMTARTAAAGAADVADARIVAALAADADLMALGDDQFADFLGLPRPPAHVPNFAALKAALPAANPLAALPEATLNKRIMTARTAAAGAADVADARIVAALAADADLMALGDDQFADFLNLPHPPAHVPNFAALKAALPAANPLAALPEATLNKRIMTARTAAAGAADVADARIVAALAADADLMALGDDQFADFLNLPRPPAHVADFAAVKAALPVGGALDGLPNATLNKRILAARAALGVAADVADARVLPGLAADADVFALGDDQFADFLNLPRPPAHVADFAAVKAALPVGGALDGLPNATLNKRILAARAAAAGAGDMNAVRAALRAAGHADVAALDYPELAVFLGRPAPLTANFTAVRKALHAAAAHPRISALPDDQLDAGIAAIRAAIAGAANVQIARVTLGALGGFAEVLALDDLVLAKLLNVPAAPPVVPVVASPAPVVAAPVVAAPAPVVAAPAPVVAAAVTTIAQGGGTAAAVQSALVSAPPAVRAAVAAQVLPTMPLSTAARRLLRQ